jgi:hypothetical protein
VGHRAGPRFFQGLVLAFTAHRRVHTQLSARAPAEEWDLTMRRIQRIEKLEHRVERIFLGISTALIIFVLLGILIAERLAI